MGRRRGRIAKRLRILVRTFSIDAVVMVEAGVVVVVVVVVVADVVIGDELFDGAGLFAFTSTFELFGSFLELFNRSPIFPPDEYLSGRSFGFTSSVDTLT